MRSIILYYAQQTLCLCYANNEHRGLMNDYNLYWTEIKAKYSTVKVSNQN